MGIGNIADTGMQAAMSNMEVISNNIANANTIGFKKSLINFSDIYPFANGSANQIGLGVKIASVNQDFSVGSLTNTSQPLDLAINNSGFFVVKDPTSGQVSYTRAGRFQATSGFITTLSNQHVQGYPAMNGSIPAGGSISDIQINTASLPASATENIHFQTNLDSNATVPVGAFDPSNSATFNYQSSDNIFDSLGNTHNITTYYVKTGANAWNVNVYVDGTSVGSGTMTFSTNGQLTATTGLSSLSYSPTTGATSPQTFSLNMGMSTQFGTANSATVSHDGFAPGNYTGVTVDQNGIVSMQYTNGQSQIAGQIAIANFLSPQGLIDIGDMSWIASSSSGTPVVSQSNSTGNIQTSTVELSNVDLTTEMVNLLTAQQAFSANAQVENVYNEVMQTVIKL